jgi:hypothetical protein
VSLKLGPIKKEKEVKLSCRVVESLEKDLESYAEAYQDIYGTAVEKEELVPLILQQFLDSDRKFKNWRKEQKKNAAVGTAEA